jgi:hypothetical protein
MTKSSLGSAIQREGFAVLASLFSSERIACLISDLDRTLPNAGAPARRPSVWPIGPEHGAPPSHPLHFEFAPEVTLPGGLEWHQFVRVTA